MPKKNGKSSHRYEFGNVVSFNVGFNVASASAEPAKRSCIWLYLIKFGSRCGVMASALAEKIRGLQGLRSSTVVISRLLLVSLTLHLYLGYIKAC